MGEATLRESWPRRRDYVPPRVEDLYGPPDVVLRFRPVQDHRELRARASGSLTRHLDAVAPVPSRGDGDPGAVRARRLRARIRARHRDAAPIVGDRLVLKKRNSVIRSRGRTGRRFVGKTNAWQAFEEWALREIRLALALHPLAEVYPLARPAHLVWRYHPPDARSWPDHPGVAETVADLMQDAGLLENDRLVVCGDLSWIGPPDPECPRLEVWVRPEGARLSVLESPEVAVEHVEEPGHEGADRQEPERHGRSSRSRSRT